MNHKNVLLASSKMRLKNKQTAIISLLFCGMLSFGICDAAKAESGLYDGSWEMTPTGLRITPPADLGASQHAWSFEIVTDRE
ncbi:MAG: hypothetical protein PF904_07175 [Kiritimatiellae bacterium]|jgi:hypothetical protein|nr:hypothetical protein [Kiritimatiellia bacterium]